MGSRVTPRAPRGRASDSGSTCDMPASALKSDTVCGRRDRPEGVHALIPRAWNEVTSRGRGTQPRTQSWDTAGEGSEVRVRGRRCLPRQGGGHLQKLGEVRNSFSSEPPEGQGSVSCPEKLCDRERAAVPC